MCFSVFYVILGELWTNLGAGRIIQINTWYTVAMVTNASGFGTPTVSRSNSADWWELGRKMHAEETTVVFAESAKNTVFWPKYGFFGTLALFLDDVSMTSSGGVKVGWRQHDVIRWRGGLRVVHGDDEVADRWSKRRKGALTRRWRSSDAGLAG